MSRYTVSSCEMAHDVVWLVDWHIVYNDLICREGVERKVNVAWAGPAPISPAQNIPA